MQDIKLNSGELYAYAYSSICILHSLRLKKHSIKDIIQGQTPITLNLHNKAIS